MLSNVKESQLMKAICIFCLCIFSGLCGRVLALNSSEQDQLYNKNESKIDAVEIPCLSLRELQLISEQVLRSQSSFGTDSIRQKLKSSLEPYLRGRICIKGFLCKSKENKWFLASEPDLKTCCIGAKAKICSQIALNHSFSDKLLNSFASIRGVLDVAPEVDNQLELVQLFQFTDIEMANDRFPWKTVSVLLAGIGILGLFLFLYNQNSKTH